MQQTAGIGIERVAFPGYILIRGKTFDAAASSRKRLLIAHDAAKSRFVSRRCTV